MKTHPSSIPNSPDQHIEFLLRLLGQPDSVQLFEAIGIERLVISLDANVMLQDVKWYHDNAKPRVG
jgi:hypothetical protein